MNAKSCLSLVSAILCLTAGAAVEFDGQKNIIQVSDFAKDSPLTLKKLQQVDTMNAWGKVKYEKATDAYTIEADLYVGKNDGTDTYMQVGTEKNPKETLLLKGNLIIHPFGFLGEKGKRHCINRLNIGDKSKPDIKPSVTLDSGKGIFLGCIPTSSWQVKNGAGGELYIHNSTVGGNGPTRMAGRNHFTGWNCIFKANDTKFAYFKEPIIFETHAYMTCTVEKCTFTDSGSAFLYSTQVFKLKDCIFSNLSGAAFYGFSAPIYAELTDCKFEDNKMNWDMSKGGSIKCTDCVIGAPVVPDQYGSAVNPKTKKSEPAFFVSLRHIIIQTVDAGGKPVKDAAVTVASESGNADSVYVGQAITGADGLTPGKGDDKALLLTETKAEAGKQDKPVKLDYAYTVTAEKDGKKVELKNFKPQKSWDTVTVTVK